MRLSIQSLVLCCIYMCLYIYVLLYLSSMYIQSIHIPASYILCTIYTSQPYIPHSLYSLYTVQPGSPVCHIAYRPYSHIDRITYALISSVLQYVCMHWCIQLCVYHIVIVYTYIIQQYVQLIAYINSIYQQHIVSYNI